MPDFLLEIGTEEIPARMIDSARDELARRVGELLQRERLGDSPASAGLLHAAPAGCAGLRTSRRRSPTSASRSPGRRSKSPTKMECPLPRPKLSRARSTSRSTRWRRSRRQRANIWPRRCRRRAALQPRFWPKRCPRRLPASTGRRACTGAASRPSASCVRCAGWSRCSTAKWCHWSSPAFAPAEPARAIAFCRRDRWPIRLPADYVGDAGRRLGHRQRG